jgi:hypothetical protein
LVRKKERAGFLHLHVFIMFEYLNIGACLSRSF